MKTLQKHLASTAVAAITLGAGGALLADDAAAQVSDSPAGSTQAPPTPSVTEELVYLRDALAIQSLRMDEAEQLLRKQADLIDRQMARIGELEAALGGRAPAQFGDYTVKRGDTLHSIARRFETSVQEMAQANSLRPPYVLRVGQQLKAPGAPATEAGARLAAAPAAPAQKQARQPEPQATAKKRPPKKPEAKPQKTAAAQPAQQQQRQPQQAAAQTADGLPVEVGQRPDDEPNTPFNALFSDIGGILTPRGTLFLEPEFGYSTTSDNRFFFQGTEILDALLIGAIEATDTDRNALTSRLGLRYGLTSRLEVSARSSYVYRSDRVSGVSINDNGQIVRDINGDGFGDLELGVNYQLNQGRKFPYTILNLRARAPVGKGPFDVNRDENGRELELATGSGFWTIEPSLTFTIPTAPASIFANIGYQANLRAEPELLLGDPMLADNPGNLLTIERFNAGDAIRGSVGVGLAVNDRFSINLGYNQSYFFETTSVLSGRNADGQRFFRSTTQPSISLGSINFGGSYAIDRNLRLNFTTGFGATDEAPDAQFSIRLQRRLFQ